MALLKRVPATLEAPVEDVWTADQLATQTMVWQMVRDGAVHGARLASEFERSARFVPVAKAYLLVILACLARAAGGPEPAEDRRPPARNQVREQPADAVELD
jgi:hypothetical protein